MRGMKRLPIRQGFHYGSENLLCIVECRHCTIAQLSKAKKGSEGIVKVTEPINDMLYAST
jgi:hypothetical protein